MDRKKMNLNLFFFKKNGLGHGHQLQMHEMSFNIHNEKGGKKLK